MNVSERNGGQTGGQNYKITAAKIDFFLYKYTNPSLNQTHMNQTNAAKVEDAASDVASDEDAARQTSIISDILQEINNYASQSDARAEIELELRYAIDPRRYPRAYAPREEAVIQLAKDLIKQANKDKLDSQIEQSVNFIIETNQNSNSNQNANSNASQNAAKASKIRKMLFIDGQQTESSYYLKNKLITPLTVKPNQANAIDIPYKIHISSEETISNAAFNVQLATTARIKLRYSIEVLPASWRLDITLVRTVVLPGSIQELKDAKQRMLFPLSIVRFGEDAPWREATGIEFELEFIGDRTRISMADLIYADKFFETHPMSHHGGQTNSQTNPQSDAETNSQTDMQYSDLLRRIAQIIKPYFANKANLTLKQLSNQVIELDKNTYNRDVQGHLGDYYVTDKVDGKRAMILLDYDNDIFCAISDVIVTLNPKASRNEKHGEKHGVYLADSEEYQGTYYIFDVLMYASVNICKQSFSNRLDHVNDVLECGPALFKSKPFTRLNAVSPAIIRDQIIALRSEKAPYETDGAIFTPANDNYTDMVVYKYKPIDKLSVDFLVKRCPKKLLGIKPYICGQDETVYLLFCGVAKLVYDKLCLRSIDYYNDIFGFDIREKLKENHYAPIQFEPSDYKHAYIYIAKNKAALAASAGPDLDNQVCEFVIRPATDAAKFLAWKLIRIRHDRQVDIRSGTYFGNNYAVAESLWFNSQNPLNIEDELLREASAQANTQASAQINMREDTQKPEDKAEDKTVNYFQKHESEEHRAQRNFNSFVKSQVFSENAGTKYVLDMASGKGQDLNRYAQFNMGSGCILFTEVDRTAIMELINRKHQYARARDDKRKDQNNYKNANQHASKVSHNADHGGMRVYIARLDYNEDYKINIRRVEETENNIPSQGFDLIMCNLAFHYFLGSKKHIDNILHFIDYYLRPGGRFIFSGFDGQKIMNLLDGRDKWEAGQGRFSIVRRYESEILQQYGQIIGVMLPFSDTQYYDEYLINIKFLEREFAKRKITLESNKSFSEFGNGPKLDATDLEYVSLYHYYTFVKKEVSAKYKTAGKKFTIHHVK